ncbi:MAG: hypothetical protein V4568_01875 [Pseudomonadota bacterium]
MSGSECNDDHADRLSAAPAVRAEIVDEKSPLRSVALVLVSFAIFSITLAAYHFVIVRQTIQRFAVVDVAELYRAKEAEFSKIIADPKATDVDRVKAMESAQRFAKDLQALIEKLPKECGCVVLNKAAVMNANESLGLTDLTPQARKAVGL